MKVNPILINTLEALKLYAKAREMISANYYFKDRLSNVNSDSRDSSNHKSNTFYRSKKLYVSMEECDRSNGSH